jgi:hypothetical protein
LEPVIVKSAVAPFVILLLLAVAACGRQHGNGAGAGAAPDDATVISEGYGRSTVDHDPRAMTTIDVATGDLSGLATYAAGRMVAPPAYRAASAGTTTLAMPLAQEVGGSVAAAQNGADALPSPAAPATTENSAMDSDRASAAAAGNSGAIPILPQQP